MNIQSGKKFRDEKYYQLAHQGSLDLTHPSMKKILKLCSQAHSILDMGCGEGSRLNLLLSNITNNPKAFGVDISQLAIKKAKLQYPSIQFNVGDLKKIPFNDKQFDLIYSTYVFEHLTYPEKVILEAYRILKKKGNLAIIAPNFGAPNRRSPNSTENKLSKLINGFLNDLVYLIKRKTLNLNWTRVDPKKNVYSIDADTTIEPYLGTLISYCKLKFSVNFYSSFWEQDRFSFFQLPFRILGKFGIYPFFLWGPHLMIVLEKKYDH